MKMCISCKKMTEDSARFCPACGAIMDIEPAPKEKWYYSKASLFVSFLCVGPFMLPLVWLKPGLSTNKKIFYSVLIIAVSWLIYVMFMRSLASIRDAYSLANSAQGI